MNYAYKDTGRTKIIYADSSDLRSLKKSKRSLMDSLSTEPKNAIHFASILQPEPRIPLSAVDVEQKLFLE